MSVAAAGVVGVKLYVLANDDAKISNAYWIAFPNRDIWSKGSYRDDIYMAGVAFHEMLHNTGFPMQVHLMMLCTGRKMYW